MIQYSGDTPSHRILAHLRRSGEASIRELEQVLDVSTTAVREQLVRLERRGLIAVRRERGRPGRPRLIYALSERGHASFPPAAETLAVALLEAVASDGDFRQVDRLLLRVAEQIGDGYRTAIDGPSAGDRVEQLVDAIEARGIPAESGSGQHEIWLLACPYHAFIARHPELCAMERQTFERALDTQLTLETTVRGGRRVCCFRQSGHNDGDAREQ